MPLDDFIKYISGGLEFEITCAMRTTAEFVLL